MTASGDAGPGSTGTASSCESESVGRDMESLTHAPSRVSSVNQPRATWVDTERGFNSPELLHEWRANWASLQNRYLKQELGTEAPQVSHLSYAARGIDRVPGKHLGPSATALERRRQATERGRLNRGAAERTARLKALRERQDALAAKLAPPVERHLGQVAAEMVGLKERLEKARAEQRAALRETLDALKGRRSVSEAKVEGAALVPFDREVRGAARELD